MFTEAAVVPADFSAMAPVFAVAMAAVLVYAGNFVYERWGV